MYSVLYIQRTCGVFFPNQCSTLCSVHILAEAGRTSGDAKKHHGWMVGKGGGLRRRTQSGRIVPREEQSGWHAEERRQPGAQPTEDRHTRSIDLCPCATYSIRTYSKPSMCGVRINEFICCTYGAARRVLFKLKGSVQECRCRRCRLIVLEVMCGTSFFS